MDDYIKRDDLLNALAGCTRVNGEPLDDYDTMMMYEITDLIECIPATNVREIVRGKWVDDPYVPWTHRCSNCGSSNPRLDDAYHTAYKSNYCPNCGADMRGNTDDEE